MASKRSERLQVVQNLMQRKRKQADQMLAASRQRVAQDRQQIEQLEQFVAEYQRQYEAAGRQGMGVGEMQVYQAFIARISGALTQQRKALEMNLREQEAVEKYWAQCYGKVVALDSMLDKELTAERQAQEKKLQQQLDERAQHIRTPFI